MSIETQLAAMVGILPDGISEGVALGTGLADGYDLYPSAVGTVVVTFNPEGVSSLDLAESDFLSRFVERTGRSLIRAEPPTAWGRHLPRAIEAGTPGKVPVDLRPVTPFQEKVLRLTTQIPRGEVRPYGWLAKEVSRPGATRAVGSVMARNPIPLMIPCHRVVRSDGHMGNYSLGGPDLKLRLLEHEGADPARLERLAQGQVRVQGDVTSGLFCHPTCHVIRRSRIGDVIDFHSVDQAMSAGLRPCPHCRPV
jgi:O-6-methylguanine DNA methyltransferase